MYLVADKIMCSLQQLSRENDNRGGAIADFLVLHICQLHQDLHREASSTDQKRWFS